MTLKLLIRPPSGRVKSSSTSEVTVNQNRTKERNYLNGEYLGKFSGSLPGKVSRFSYETRPQVNLPEAAVLNYFVLRISHQLKPKISKTARKILLRRFEVELLLQFTIEDLINPLVTLCFLSSDE